MSCIHRLRNGQCSDASTGERENAIYFGLCPEPSRLHHSGNASLEPQARQDRLSRLGAAAACWVLGLVFQCLWTKVRPTQLMRLRLGPMALRQKLDLDFCLGTAAVSLFQHNCTPTAKWSLCALPVSSSCKTLECVQHDSHTYGMSTKSMRWPWWPSGDIQVAVGPWWIMLVLGRHNCCVWWWSKNKPVLAEQVFSISKTTGSHLGPLLALASMSTNRGIFWPCRCVISCVSVHQRFLSSKGLPLCGACIAKTWRICVDYLDLWLSDKIVFLCTNPMGWFILFQISMPCWPWWAPPASLSMLSAVLMPAGLLVSCRPRTFSLKSCICSLRNWSCPA